MKEIAQVHFGGSMAIYIDGELKIYRKGQFKEQEILEFLLKNIHLGYNPVKKIVISPYSTFWDSVSDYKGSWLPSLNLKELEKKLDPEHDVVS